MSRQTRDDLSIRLLRRHRVSSRLERRRQIRPRARQPRARLLRVPLTPQRLVPIPRRSKARHRLLQRPRSVRQPRQSAPRIRVPIRVPRRSKRSKRQLRLADALSHLPSDRERDRLPTELARRRRLQHAHRVRAPSRAHQRARGVHSRARFQKPSQPSVLVLVLVARRRRARARARARVVPSRAPVLARRARDLARGLAR